MPRNVNFEEKFERHELYDKMRLIFENDRFRNGEFSLEDKVDRGRKVESAIVALRDLVEKRVIFGRFLVKLFNLVPYKLLRS